MPGMRADQDDPIRDLQGLPRHTAITRARGAGVVRDRAEHDRLAWRADAFDESQSLGNRPIWRFVRIEHIGRAIGPDMDRVPAEHRIGPLHDLGAGFEIDTAGEADADRGQHRGEPVFADELGLDANVSPP